MAAERKVRVLVAIACYGQKNLPFLRKIVQAYQGMAMDIDIVVLSEAPKEVAAGVQVIVGLPSKNTWSLPFAHKAVFAEAADRYDLFVYSEDDVEVSERHLRAFLRVTEALPPDEIAGFLRYEMAGEKKVLTDVHGCFHWKVDSVRRRGGFVVAEFTNEHAGFYILTQAQLKAGLRSGGFLKAPYEGRYGMPETAATDPYTSCGMRKVVCISTLDDFLLHHMSNLYIERHGVALAEFQEQVAALLAVAAGTRVATILGPVESKMPRAAWSKSYYERARPELSQAVPAGAERILSVGSGSGGMEEEWKKRGATVTAIPLDSVIGVHCERRGMEVVYGDHSAAWAQLGERRFDCVVVSHWLHLLSDPWPVLEGYGRLLAPGGALVVAGYNFDYLPHLVRRLLGTGQYAQLRRFEESGVGVFGVHRLEKQINGMGLHLVSRGWYDDVQPRRFGKLRRRPGRFTSRNWVVQAEKRG